MSGREPVAAFFPSIDRNLMAELDRHLRAPQAYPPPAHETPTSRPDIAGVVEAVEQAASSIAAMTGRIHELEAHVGRLDAANQDLGLQLSQRAQQHEAAEAKARAQNERAAAAEHIASQHMARADALERDLATALADLNRVTDAIANALGLPETV